MKIISINLGNFSSTGKIAKGIQDISSYYGCEYYLSYPENNSNKLKCDNDIIIGTKFGRRISVRICQVVGFHGCGSVFATMSLIKQIEAKNPNILHLHNLHGSYINIPMLFRFIKKRKMKVVWTLHDCWSFTGQCPYFTLANCEKWKTGCHSCPNYKSYPSSLWDNSKLMWKLKKKWFTGVKDMTLVTPSVWLCNLVRQSFMSDYPVKVINNGIDLSVFYPHKSDFKEKKGLMNKKVILGVAFDWGIRKGLDVFVELSKNLPDSYQIVLVGTTPEIVNQLPKNIITINRTNSQEELAEIYSAADVFVNPTREENYPTVNMEAIACGTPVVTFKTGGSPEIISNETGVAVEVDDKEALMQAIKTICESQENVEKVCIAHSKDFNQVNRFKEYYDLYQEIENKKL